MSAAAGRQEGVLHRNQLRALGLSDKQIAWREQHDALHELYTDVFAVGHRNISPLGHLIAALLSCGRTAFLSHRTAAAIHGLRPINTHAIEITVVGKNAPRRPGLIVHSTVKPPDQVDLRTRGLLRFSSVARMFVESAAHEKPAELTSLITLAVRKQLLNIDGIEAALHRHARRPGVGRLKAALGRYRPEPDRTSNLERAFDAWLAEHPEIPEPLRNVHIDGWEIDCWWPEQKVALELDGRPYHVTVGEMDRDRLKDTKLQLMEIRPMRVTGERFDHDRRGVHADLCALLGLQFRA